VAPNGAIINKYSPQHVSVNGDEVLLNIRLNSTDPVTLHAVRRFKIESHDTDVTKRLTPLQPMFMRSKSATPYNKWQSIGLDIKPVDFSCSELDLTSMPIGTNSTTCRAFGLSPYCRHARSVDGGGPWRIRFGQRCDVVQHFPQ
jgi:hypothetical protein